MTSLDITNCEIGTITSRADHSCKFAVITPELLASQAGELMRWHGRACRVAIFPHDSAPDEVITVDTERRVKSKGERLRAVHWILWQQQGSRGDFESWYNGVFEGYINAVKEQLL